MFANEFFLLLFELYHDFYCYQVYNLEPYMRILPFVTHHLFFKLVLKNGNEKAEFGNFSIQSVSTIVTLIIVIFVQT